MLLRRQLRRGLILLIGFAGRHLQGLFDDSIGEGVEVGHQGALQVEELEPEGVVHQAAVGADAVEAQQGHEQVPRPLIRQREADLNRRLFGLQLLQACLDALADPFGRLPFHLAAGRGVERLDAAQFLYQLLLGAGAAEADVPPGVGPAADGASGGLGQVKEGSHLGLGACCAKSAPGQKI
jgi:hypothetical protein